MHFKFISTFSVSTQNGKITVKCPAKLMIKKTQNEHYRRHRITEHELKQAKDFIKTINK